MKDTIKVCVVDDDHLVREIVDTLLSAKGYTVLQAKDGQASLQILAQDTPDLLITDIMMPNQDGIETILSVKQSFPTMPILAMSGSSDASGADYLAMAQKFGADALIRKPFAAELFLEKVDGLLSHS